MQDDHDEQPADAATSANLAAQPSSEVQRGDWVGASGVSGEHVIAGERAPRLHWALMILGPVGLAAAILVSLWSSSRQVERSVHIQVDANWVPGEQLAMRTRVLGSRLDPLEPETAVSLTIRDAAGQTHSLAALDNVGPGLAQGQIAVPALALGEAELVVHFEPDSETGIEPFDERVAITVLDQRTRGAGHQVISEHMLQWADDTDEQPADVRIDLRPGGRLLASFDNEVFVRVTDPAGKPWRPKSPDAPPTIQVLLISGEWGGLMGSEERPPILYQGPVDSMGLARFVGSLASDVVRFEVRLIGDAELAALAPPAPTDAPPTPNTTPPDSAPPNTAPTDAPPAPNTAPTDSAPPNTAPPDSPRYFTGPKRRLRFVSHAGTVRVEASTNFAHPGEVVEIAVAAISARKPVYIDAHGDSGAWLDTFTLQIPRTHEWTIPTGMAADPKGASIMQFEAYQSTLRPEDSSSLARVQVTPPSTTRFESVAGLIARQREQLALPRVDKQFEIGRERAYLSAMEAELPRIADDEAAVDRTRAFLLGSLEAVVHGPPMALNTRPREEQTLHEFKRRAVLGVRWFLLGGGLLFITVMSAMVWRNQRKLELQTNDALGLVPGSPDSALVDDEVLADQSLALVRARRDLLGRGMFTIVLMVAALLLTIAMLESLVWDY